VRNITLAGGAVPDLRGLAITLHFWRGRRIEAEPGVERDLILERPFAGADSIAAAVT
jgi:hypothetical protein